jgi:hypothetical protein
MRQHPSPAPPEKDEDAVQAEDDEQTENAEPAAPRWRGLRLVGIVGALIVIVLVVGGVVTGRLPGGSSLSSAKVGECLAYDASKIRYTEVDCADPKAAFRLFASATDSKACIDVPGTSRTYTDGGDSYCIGAKSVDPATTINGVKPGDCIRFSGNEPSRAACASGSLPVLLVINDVPKQSGGTDYLGDLCIEHGIEKVRQTYAWGLSSDKSPETGSWDRLLCLGAAV